MRIKGMSEPEQVLFTSATIWALSDGLLGPLFAVFAQGIGGDILSVTWAWALFLAITGIGMMFTGRLGDRYGHHALSVWGYIICAVFTFGYVFVVDQWGLLFVQLGLGVGLALCNPTWDALYDKYSGEGDNDGWLWGTASAGRYIAQAFAVVIGGLIVTYASFTVLFTIMGCIMTLAACVQSRILKYR
ncbi:MAG: hypothetical protein RI911_459 [Candidatus Parcubacteria bacterium]|jgi:MFS family permease